MHCFNLYCFFQAAGGVASPQTYGQLLAVYLLQNDTYVKHLCHISWVTSEVLIVFLNWVLFYLEGYFWSLHFFFDWVLFFSKDIVRHIVCENAIHNSLPNILWYYACQFFFDSVIILKSAHHRIRVNNCNWPSVIVEQWSKRGHWLLYQDAKGC